MINNKEKNFISAILYVRNNSDIILDFLKKLDDVLKSNFEKYEIICVNDYSDDGSVEKIRQFSENFVGAVISIINMSHYQGLESSMKAGQDFSIGDFVYEFDSIYMDYNPSLIMDIYNQSLKGFDIVSAVSKNNKNRSSKLFYKLFNDNSNNIYNLQTETFRIISRRGINKVQSMSKTIPYRKAIYTNCGVNLCSLNYDPIIKIKNKLNRQVKSSKYNLATESLILFTNIAYKFSVIMAIIFLISTFFVAGYSIFVFINNTPIAGWTTTMLFLAFSFFGVFTFFAVVIKYLSILTNLVFKKQEYLIKSIEKLTK